ncbi:DUF6542 domain-containing protein [Mycobacterium deserti]|uniref:DUF6542 domain-containing protein n=1 Tax=Mycobacterium deserti TaxID=2978347 RepID=A0ABT2M4N4_9MYCO|nr:DUF6542 domain-containing protein [Mycobacterium deserti]MCT7657227.1 hypothetical protein [Mycobacterium deserti]
MSAQRARSAVTPDHRSAHPSFPGIPSWGAVVLAVTATAIGFAFDAGSGNKDLSTVFAAVYVIGCVAAVLAVRQSGVFTAVIQPPLILFGAVPSAYFLFHNGELDGLKDLAINCGYPLVERFPLMFFTSAGVLLIGMARWYYGMSTRRATPRTTARDTKDAKAAKDSAAGGLKSAVTSKMSSLLTHDADEDEQDDAEAVPAPRRKRSTERSTRTAASKSRTAKRTTSSRSRQNRAPETEIIEPVVERTRRARASRSTEPPVEPRRRSRTSSSNPRKSVPPADRTYERPPRRRRLDDYEPLEPHGTNGNGTHHPVSRVRYRGAEETPAPRRRTARDWEPEGWKYDV